MCVIYSKVKPRSVFHVTDWPRDCYVLYILVTTPSAVNIFACMLENVIVYIIIIIILLLLLLLLLLFVSSPNECTSWYPSSGRPNLKYRIFVLHDEMSPRQNIGVGWVHQIRTARSIRVWWEVQPTASRCCGPHHNLRHPSQRGTALPSTLSQSFITAVTVHFLLSQRRQVAAKGH